MVSSLKAGNLGLCSMLSRRSRCWQTALTLLPWGESGPKDRMRAADEPSPPTPLPAGEGRASPSRGEKRFQHRRRLALAQAPVDLRRVVAGWLAKEAWAVIDSAALG